jgi:hypothetical protein
MFGRCTLLKMDSGTTGMPKGVPFNMDRGFQVGASVRFERGMSSIVDQN